MKIILGGPGCGKTTALINEVMQCLSQGVHPGQIGFVAFTRRAAQEAVARAQSELNLTEDDLPYFRTLHSFAFREGGFNAVDLMTAKHWDEFADWMKIKIFVSSDQPHVIHTEERALAVYALSRLKCIPLAEMCKIERVDFDRADYYRRHLDKYKAARHVVDYTDLLENFVENVSPPPLHTLIVDEGQDLCALQWRMIDKLAQNAQYTIVAGDDDQAIYEWAGADTEHFLALKGERVVLPRSYRMAEKIWSVTQTITHYMSKRYEKNFAPFKEGGLVERVSDMYQLDLTTHSWLFMCRNHYQLNAPISYLRENGFPYIKGSESAIDTENCRALLAWEALRKGKEIEAPDAFLVGQKLDRRLSETDARLIRFDPSKQFSMRDLNDLISLKSTPDWMSAIVMSESEQRYYRSIKRRGESLIEKPRITVSTIHAQKGGEADHVALFTDMSPKSYETYTRNPSSEARVFYVGASRAREKLFIFDPKTYANFKIPDPS